MNQNRDQYVGRNRSNCLFRQNAPIEDQQVHICPMNYRAQCTKPCFKRLENEAGFIDFQTFYKFVEEMSDDTIHYLNLDTEENQAQ